MMICLAIMELLDGLRRFLLDGKVEYTFVGTDSSFSVLFRRTGKGRIAVRCGTTFLGEVEDSHLCKAILSGVESFLGHPGNQLPGDAPVREDLLAAIAGVVPRPRPYRRLGARGSWAVQRHARP